MKKQQELEQLLIDLWEYMDNKADAEWTTPNKEMVFATRIEEAQKNMQTTKNLWWGYKHTSGTLQAKRYFDKLDIEEAHQSPFCQIVVTPFEADSRDEALEIIKEQTS